MMAVQQSTLRMSLIDEVTARARVIGGALQNVQRQANGLMSPFRGIGGQLLAFGGAYFTVTEGIGKSFGNANAAQAALTEIGIKADLTATQLQQMDRRLVAIAPNVNQLASELRGGVDTMLAMGTSAQDAMGAIPAIGRAATATGASITDLSSASTSAMQNLKVLPSEISRMLDGMTSAGNAGAFELRDMASYFPQLTASAQALGMQGVSGVYDMAAALQIARRGAGDASTAANNLSDFMGKIVTPQTIKNFKKFGVDVTKELQKAQKNGISPIEHFIKLIDEKTKGGKPELLTQLFGDKQTLDFIRPMISDFKDYLRIRGDAERASGAVADAYNRRMGDAQQKIKAFQVSMENLQTSIGNKLLGPVSTAAQEVSDVLNTLDERFTVFDRLSASTDGFWKGLGFGAGDQMQSLKEFLIGVQDAGKAADQYGAAFKQFHEYGQSVRSLTTAINESPALKFMTELGVAVGAMGLSKWFRLYAMAAGIKAVVDAAKGAESISEFVENMKGLSALEWAGVGAGLLMVANRAKAVAGWFQKANAVVPGGVPGTAGSGGVPLAGAPASALSLKNLFGGVLKGAIPALLGWAGEEGIRSGFKWWYKEDYREPPDMAKSMDNTWAAWQALIESIKNAPDPIGQSPYRQQAMDNAIGSRAAGIGGSTTETLPGKTADDLDMKTVRLDASSISEISRPIGIQDVRVTNLQPPNITVHAPISITGVVDPRAAADAAVARLGATIKEQTDANFSD